MNKKAIIIYYSRSGVTEKVAKKLAESLSCDIEEIIDNENRKGMFGFIKAGREAAMKKEGSIQEIKSNLNDYDIVIIGTPVWASNMAVPVRKFCKDYKDSMKEVAFFSTQGGASDYPVFSNMEEILNKKPVSVMKFIKKDFNENYEVIIDKFCNHINKI